MTMTAILPTILLVTLVAVPLVWRIGADRRRDRADLLRADIRSAINRRLQGESLLTVDVVPKTPWHPGRVVLWAPEGYEDLAASVWRDVLKRTPAGYDLVVQTSRAQPTKPLQHAA